jgi:aminopeptidase YwaD
LDTTHPFISLKRAYQGFYNCILTLHEDLFLTSMNGWSPRDVVAHLIAWNRHMIQASSAILSGVPPAYYADAPNDYRNINAGYVARYASRSKSELLGELSASMAEFEGYIAALNPGDLVDNHGVFHYRGRPATVAGIIASLTGDYQQHLAEIKTWLRNKGDSPPPGGLMAKSHSFLNTMCQVKPNRRTGSPGNQAATEFFANCLRPYGYELDMTLVDCLDYLRGESFLLQGETSYEIHSSPYSSSCDIQAGLVVVSTVAELEKAYCRDKILLMLGEICSEQLMPKNFVFYNPEHHQKIIALLESKQPAAIITATEKNPELVGALYPFPLIVDGDFDIPSVYCTATVGETLAGRCGELFHLKIDSRRIPSQACNVIASLNREAAQKIVITAHIDAYEDTPGALDNASGTVVLLLLAEMLTDYRGDYGVEIAAFNGEDHYSAGGQMDYLRRYGGELGNILLAINIDDAGYRIGKTAYSFYGCPPQLQGKAEAIFQGLPGLAAGEPWYQGDHMVFVQGGVPAVAFTAERMAEAMSTVTHTALDTPEMVDHQKLVELAGALNSLIRGI